MKELLLGGIHSQVPTGQKKWQAHYPTDVNGWASRWIGAKQCTQEVRLKAFQFKILHNILPTNKKLHKMGYRNNPRCSYCRNEDTIPHAFCNCKKVKEIWECFQRLFTNIEGVTMEPLNPETILFGLKNANNSTIIKKWNYLILFIKHTIYACKYGAKVSISWKGILESLKYRFRILKYLSQVAPDRHTFYWEKWMQQL